MAENGLSPLARIAKRITIEGDCWVWNGSLEANGYGRMNVNGKRTMVHRAAYELLTGEIIPADMTVDHLCFVRNCVKPSHLEIVSRGENSKRSNHPTMVNARKNVCKRGHSLTGDNVYVHPKRGTRHCRECAKVRDKNRTVKAAEIGKPEREYENVPAPPQHQPAPVKEPAAPTPEKAPKEPVPA